MLFAGFPLSRVEYSPPIFQLWSAAVDTVVRISDLQPLVSLTFDLCLCPVARGLRSLLSHLWSLIYDLWFIVPDLLPLICGCWPLITGPAPLVSDMWPLTSSPWYLASLLWLSDLWSLTPRRWYLIFVSTDLWDWDLLGSTSVPAMP
jgi:hypothetical protein